LKKKVTKRELNQGQVLKKLKLARTNRRRRSVEVNSSGFERNGGRKNKEKARLDIRVGCGEGGRRGGKKEAISQTEGSGRREVAWPLEKEERRKSEG